MKLTWQHAVDKDLLDEWRRHPVTAWLRANLRDDPKLRLEWRALDGNALLLGRMQGRADVLEAVYDILDQ